MRILTLSTLYPHAGAPTHGVFVENRLRALLAEGDIEARVIAPVPWFPFRDEIFGAWARHASAPARETRHGIEIEHPRYVIPPKVGMTIAVHSLIRCFEQAARRLIKQGWDFDLIDAHYYYPDGVAAVEVARRLGKPVTVTARGTDINLIPDFPRQRRMIMEAADTANASITVCKALRTRMVHLGADPQKIHVMRNGVDLDLFRPRDREATRADLGLSGTLALSVGHLIERKGHDLVIDAVAAMPDVSLLIAGEGPEETALKAQVETLGIENRVTFLGALPHEDLADIYGAADVLVLASSREGWPNVLLEAMACGTPCVATPVWGSGEVVAAPAAGRLAGARSVDAISTALRELLADPPAREDTRAYAEQFSWKETAMALKTLFKDIADDEVPAASPASADWQVDAPFQLPGETPALMVTVDTEEIFDWAENDFDNHRLSDPADFVPFQDMCERHGIKPLYFLTWPLMRDAATADYFRDLHRAGRADLGLHLHQWVTPPELEENTPYRSYQCNLSPELHEAKLRSLVDTFHAAFGFAPVSHRAGRYGVSPHVHEQLLAAGVWMDFSPSSGFDLSGDGGPDFSGHSSASWWRKPDNEGNRLLCVPATGGRMLRRTRIMAPASLATTSDRSPLPSLVKGLTSPVRLSPEGYELGDMQALTIGQIREGTGLMTFSLHSSSLTPGATPYGANADGVEALLARSDAYFSWFVNERAGRFMSLEELGDSARQEPAKTA